jgi:beta-lactamase superfamily II metal-dependent hydrolase
MGLDLTFLPASDGDAIWVEWGETERSRMIIDFGRERTGLRLAQNIIDLPSDQRSIALIIVTHVDADHIAGAVNFFDQLETIDLVEIGDIWFNAWKHLAAERQEESKLRELESWGGAQGELLASCLHERSWNQAFHGGPVAQTDPLTRIDLANGMTVTVLGPRQERLVALRSDYAENVRKALGSGRLTSVPEGLESYGRQRPTRPILTNWPDIDALADTKPEEDTAPANGSSICVLLEYHETRILLTGDAYPRDVVEYLSLLGASMPTELDLVKLPHHGSAANVSDALLDAIRCPAWVVSTNGTRHHHPDAAAIARVLRERRSPRPHLVFNEPSEFTAWWSDPAIMKRFGFTSEVGTREHGAAIHFA